MSGDFASPITIRLAKEGDFEWVAELMHAALDPYYSGDHRAHARRIFDAHISGGLDKLGFFSVEQRMFIAELQGIRVGLVHVVGKRQSTYKISPLIVAPDFQRKHGLGSRLLQQAEQYARDRDSRQLYCTVAESNTAAMRFFLLNGFTRAGRSSSHYKSDVTECMLYKPLYSAHTIASLDRVHVSVVPLDDTRDDLKKQVSTLLLDKLPSSFDGIDHNWVAALFEGYSRRDTADINFKYKLIYVALGSDGTIIGVATATPKKGHPIKIMPFVSSNLVAFEAMLIDLPYQLVPYGHKLYIHVTPGPDEVIALQRLGWTLDAALPSAYSAKVVTQQWGFSIGAATMRTMRVKKRFFDLICSGEKNLEVRVGYDAINRIRVGEHIKLITHVSEHIIRVNAIRKYGTFREMLDAEPYKRIAPDATSQQEVLSLLESIYAPEKERLGVVVLEIGDNGQ